MDDNRYPLTAIAWLGYLGVTVYLANTLGPVAIPFVAIMMVPLIVMMNFVWGKENNPGRAMDSSKRAEKRKRERIDRMIRDMSDEELYHLRQRLQDGTLDEDMFYEHVVGDDGELISRR